MNMKMVRSGDSLFTDTKRYVVKVFKKFNQSALSHSTAAHFPRGSIIVPIKVMKWKGSGVRRFLSWSGLRDDIFYLIEIQEYGGQDFRDFLYQYRQILTFEDFSNLWRSMIDILEDVDPYIKKGRVFLDIKMKNMVWDKRRLRLIDIHYESIGPDIYTPSILNMPIQFLNQYWHGKRSSIETSFRQSSSKYFKKDHIFFNLINRLHHDPSSIDQAIRQFKTRSIYTPQVIQRIKLFLVVYPLFMTVLIVMELQRVSTRTPEQKRLISDVSRFCFDTLYNRGADILPFRPFITDCKNLLTRLDNNIGTQKNDSAKSGFDLTDRNFFTNK